MIHRRTYSSAVGGLVRGASVGVRGVSVGVEAAGDGVVPGGREEVTLTGEGVSLLLLFALEDLTEAVVGALVLLVEDPLVLAAEAVVEAAPEFAGVLLLLLLILRSNL